ncbi:uncharacterized protein LOC110100711 isoform X2 [Dendrobium catenatum]|uniref:uncharacterized protein LOC110100711 isoform X2 n=1 Tax=Dendrobium catenatum TaxID=906689 RepID=UPI00109F3527|nr:uncharacterized protein LOC110100711 isoform X2 [Dendrobium catenatum]
MDSDTTDPSYWLNWRFFFCATGILCCIALASILIWKYEGSEQDGGEQEEARNGKMGDFHKDGIWMPCLRTIHPAWLLVFRAVTFVLCVVLLVVDIVVKGASQLYYYTQIDYLLLDPEGDISVSPTNSEIANGTLTVKNRGLHENLNIQKIVNLGGYLFQIIYQTNAGAVMLTDFVFWLIIFPFLTIKDYDLSFLQIGMHSLNAVFLIGDTALNSMLFPWFRIAYFMLWTSIYVIFQWIIHACISIWWPYPFLDLSSAHSPIWYLAVTALHAPCYAVFPLIIKLKHYLLKKWFPHSYYLIN